MTDRQSDAERAYEEVRVPAALRDRVDELFREYRGYEPASLQESLSLVCDVADGRLAPAPTAETPGSAADPAAHDDAPSLPTTDADHAVPEARIDAIDEVFPYDWDVDPTVRSYLPRVVDHYLDDPEGHVDQADREAAAFRAVAQAAGVSPNDLREVLVSTLYGGAGLSEGLAAEFFTEALLEVAEVDERPPTGQREAASDGGLASARSSGEFSVDSLLADDDAEPTADCEACGDTTLVNDLETVIGPEDGSTVQLLCSRCADGGR
jgi:hypothetical protein